MTWMLMCIPCHRLPRAASQFVLCFPRLPPPPPLTNRPPRPALPPPRSCCPCAASSRGRSQTGWPRWRAGGGAAGAPLGEGRRAGSPELLREPAAWRGRSGAGAASTSSTPCATTRWRVDGAAGARPGGGRRRSQRCVQLSVAVCGTEQGDEPWELAARVQLVGPPLVPLLLRLFTLLGVRPPPSWYIAWGERLGCRSDGHDHRHSFGA